MNKAQKEQTKKEFLERMAYRPVIVSNGKWKVTMDEYTEQEQYARPVKPIEYEPIAKQEVSSEGLDEGIMSKESLFETKLWYMRNHTGFDLSMRNGRRLRR